MAIFEVDEASGLPVWVQLRNRIVHLIRTRQFEPGEQLPSVRSLAAEAAINVNTVAKVYSSLEQDGYVKTVRGKGVFVREPVDGVIDDDRSIAEALFEEAIRRCLDMGMPIDEVKVCMMDVAYQMQRELSANSKERRSIYER